MVGYYTKSYVDTALAGKQRLITMITSPAVDTITAVGYITAAIYSTTGVANLGFINTCTFYVATLMQSVGTISVGTLTGSVWTDQCKLDANGDGTFTGRITSDSITSN